MKPTTINNYAVKASCPGCGGALSIFDFKDSSREFGYIIHEKNHKYLEDTFTRIHYRLLRCSGCGLAGLVKFHDKGSGPGVLEEFYPRALPTTPLPEGIPVGILNEYREAEKCFSFESYRAASALLRSTLEKTLKINGYTQGSLQKKIDQAAEDGVITSARRQKAHDDIRVFGNEVVHDEWRQVDEEEVEVALHYIQRILEDFYDDRESVLQILYAKARLEQTENGG